MIDPKDLQAIFQRFASRSHTDADLEIIRQEYEAGSFTVAAGDRSVAGPVIGSVVVTGDGNTIYTFEDIDPDELREILRQAIQSLRVSALLTYEQFAERAVKRANDLAGHGETLIGRGHLLNELQQFLSGTATTAVLHGPGGLGKTRLLLALPNILPSDTTLWYVRSRTESIEADLATLDPSKHHVIVVDDAHRFSRLHGLGELLEKPEFIGKVKLILATRSVFKDSVIYNLSIPSGDQINSLEFKPLINSDIDQLLESPPFDIKDQTIRHVIIRLADGNPLIAGIAVRLVRQGENLLALSRDQVLSHYLDETFQDLTVASGTTEYTDRYIRYLEILSALGTIDLEDPQLRERIQTTIDISASDEDRIVQQLVNIGLIERYWMTLRFASEVIADHILTYHFFDSTSSRANYQTQIIEPFFELKAKQILATLAEAEVKGEQQACLLLSQQLRELTHEFDRGGNIVRWLILDVLKDIAEVRSEDILWLVANVVDGPELPPETYERRWFGQGEITHSQVLEKAVDLLQSMYWRSLEDSLDYLYKIARYKAPRQEYKRVREAAGKVLTAIAEIKWSKPYAVQLTLLHKLESWFQQDLAEDLNLVLEVIQPMLKMEVHGAETDPTKPRHIIFRQGPLEPSECLREIRGRSLKILFTTYLRTQDIQGRIKIIGALEHTVALHSSHRDAGDQKATWEWLRLDCTNTAKFLLEQVLPHAELPILDAISGWLWRTALWAGYQSQELTELRQHLRTHKLYQFYRCLVSNRLRGDLDDDAEPNTDLYAIDQARQECMTEYLDSLSAATLDQVFHDLEMLLQHATSANEQHCSYFDLLFYSLGEKHPEYAKTLIEWAISENRLVKNFLGRIAAGLRCAEPQIAWEYIQAWSESEDVDLWKVAATSYSGRAWNSLTKEEWQLLQSLVSKDAETVDHVVIDLIGQFHSWHPMFAVELLKILATRSDAILYRVAQLLSRYETQNKWSVQFENDQDYIEIIQNLVRLPRIDYTVEKCVCRLGQIAPMLVVDFIEQRLVFEFEQSGSDYKAVPFELHHAMKRLRSTLEFPEMLRRIRDWMLQGGLWWFKIPDILERVAGGWSESLYDVLLEWVESGEEEKLKAVSFIVHDLNSGSLFYKLCREILCQTNQEQVLGSIRSAIYSTPGAIVGDFSNYWESRLEEIGPWLSDSDFRVRRFARQIAESLRQDFQRDSAREALEERNW
jgi:hypothetical protein